jgi:hypothetical protein
MRLALAPKAAVVEEDMVVTEEEEDKAVDGDPGKQRSRITLNPFIGPVRRPAGAFFFSTSER